MATRQAPNRLGGRPATPGSTAKRAPSDGFAARCSGLMVKRAEVMKSVRRSSPPNAQLVGQVQGRSMTRSTVPSGRMRMTQAPPTTRQFQRAPSASRAEPSGRPRGKPLQQGAAGAEAVVFDRVGIERVGHGVGGQEAAVRGPGEGVGDAEAVLGQAGDGAVRGDAVKPAGIVGDVDGGAVRGDVVLHGADPERTVGGDDAFVEAVAGQVRLRGGEMLEAVGEVPEADVARSAEDGAAVAGEAEGGGEVADRLDAVGVGIVGAHRMDVAADEIDPAEEAAPRVPERAFADDVAGVEDQGGRHGAISGAA